MWNSFDQHCRTSLSFFSCMNLECMISIMHNFKKPACKGLTAGVERLSHSPNVHHKLYFAQFIIQLKESRYMATYINNESHWTFLQY